MADGCPHECVRGPCGHGTDQRGPVHRCSQHAGADRGGGPDHRPGKSQQRGPAGAVAEHTVRERTVPGYPEGDRGGRPGPQGGLSGGCAADAGDPAAAREDLHQKVCGHGYGKRRGGPREGSYPVLRGQPDRQVGRPDGADAEPPPELSEDPGLCKGSGKG